jgi:NAD-dependent deacetylase
LTDPGTAPVRGRGEDFYRSFLVGYGALFFAPHAASGALFLIATVAASPAVGTAVLLGLFAATTTAHVLKRARLELEHGLYGFNGALAAFAVFSMQGEATQLHLLVVLAAALTVPITARLLDGAWCGRLGLPALSLPSLVVGFPLAWAMLRFGEQYPWSSTLLPPHLTSSSLFAAELYGAGMRDTVAGITGHWPTSLFFAVGFALHSRRLLAYLLAGLALGALVGFAFLGWVGASDFSFVVVTALPTFVALACVFTGSGWRSFVYGAVGVLASFFVWFFLGLFLTDHDLPLLTAPFFLSTASLLLVLRLLPAEASSWLPRQIPLHQLASPAAVASWSSGRASGWRYWQELAGHLDGTAADFTSAEKLARARELVRKSRRVVVLTGAGISTESGIPDYRTGAVAWKQYDTEHFRFERFMTSEESRKAYWQMSQDFFLVLRAAQPNAGHDAIVELERHGKLEAVVTQNVDRLHQRAGVPGGKVIEIHGNEHHVSCLKCGQGYEREEIYRWILNGVEVPYCSSCQGILKPDSVAFGQPMIEEESARALEAVRGCDLLIIAGTSLEVQPVASLPLVALRAGKPLVVVNLRATDYDAFATFVVRGACGAILPELCRIG